MKFFGNLFLWMASLGLLVLSSSLALAQAAIGTLGSVIGKASILRNGALVPVKKGMEIFATDELQTEKRTAVKIVFADGGNFMAFEDSKVKISEYKFKSSGDKSSLKSVFDVAKGKVRFFVKPEAGRTNETSFKTSNAVMGIRGTSGFIDASNPNSTQLVVLTGSVEVTNPKFPGQSVLVPPNQMTSVQFGKAPTLPKPAPTSMMAGLNAQAERVDPNADRGEKQAHDDKKETEKKEIKEEPKPTEKKELEKKEPEKVTPENTSPESGSTGVAPESGLAAKRDPKPDAAPESPQKVTIEEPKPVAIEKKTVFSPDGKNTLSVKNDALNGMVTPSNVSYGVSQKPNNSNLQKRESAIGQNLENVDVAKQVSGVVKANIEKLDETKAVQAAAEAPKAAAGASVKVKIKVNLPSAP